MVALFSRHAAILRLVSVLGMAVVLGSCMDPHHSDAVDALGPEASGIRPGPLHRAGQPCTVCHGGDGPASPEFSAAGTVYERRGSTVGLAGIDVVLTDSNGSTFTTTTNDVGNFYVTANRWAPVFPVYAVLRAGELSKEMATRIGREGGCAACHLGNGDARHMPHVYLKEDAEP